MREWLQLGPAEVQTQRRGPGGKPMRVVLIGPPGTDRAILAKRIVGEYGVPHLSAGDMLRATAMADTRIGLQIRKTMASGRLVRDPLVIAAVLDRILQPDAERGFVLDGFPRTMPQAVTFDDLLDTEEIGLDHVIELRADEKVLLDRAMGCQATKTGDAACVYDECEALKARLDAYNERIAPLIEYYSARNILRSIDGLQPADAVTSQLLRLTR